MARTTEELLGLLADLETDQVEQIEVPNATADEGPNLGAINRAALIAADHVVIPLAPDLFSVQGLQNTLRTRREEWAERVPKNPAPDLALPRGNMHPEGYVLLQHGVRLGRPVQAYQRWMDVSLESTGTRYWTSVTRTVPLSPTIRTVLPRSSTNTA